MKRLSLIFTILCPLVVFAAEQRCNELGANCLCSEPLQATQYVMATGGSFWNPNDTSTKECSYEVTNHPISRNVQDVQVGTDAEAINALPYGTARSTGRFLRAGNAHEGIFLVGHVQGGTVPKRMVVRFYRYYSPDYGIGTYICNGKFAQTSTPGNVIHDITHGYMSLYSWAGWTPYVDCCFTAPHTELFYSLNELQGKWWYFEVEMVNLEGGGPGSGTPFLIKSRMRNVTDNGPYLVAADATRASPGSGPQPWPDVYVSGMTPPTPVRGYVINNFRQPGTDPPQCAGYTGNLYFMAAAWDTDAGQLIGPAYEVESGGGPPPPQPPTGIPVAWLTSWLIIVTAIAGMIALLVQQRRRVHARRESDSGDSGDFPVEPMPLDGPPAAPQHEIQPVVLDEGEHELVGAGREMEGRR